MLNLNNAMMAALTLTGQRDAPDLAELLKRVSGDSDAYLTENVLKDVPPSIVDVLLRTSIVDSLSHRCGTVMGLSLCRRVGLPKTPRHRAPPPHR
jgi:ATP/maltotriose-dependent transcriptional regulator MalT